ncbi:MAG: hypothetical protein K2Q06_07120, partial [Parvularculaceae bacterium]|nr:hypothetical protein [Parvularculaceae bacterium]
DVTAAENHTTLTTISPSSIERGLIWAGTDDGRLHFTRDGGKKWTSVEKKQNLAYGPMAKLFSSERFLEDSNDLLNLTAPYSLSKAKGPAGFLNQCYRHSQGTTIYGGTSEVHRSLIAERGLGLPRTRN